MGTTIHDIAKLTGFNASTVSRALRHDPRISSATVETVARAAKKLGYVINLTARNLAAGKTGLVALIMDCPENRHQAYPASIMNEILSEHDYSLMILLHNMTRQSLSNCISKLEQKICDAAVMIPPPETLFDSPLIARLNCLEMPFCYIDRWLEHTDYPAITTDVECSIRNLMDCILREKIDGALLYQSAYNTVGRARFLCESRLLTKLNIPWTEHPDELHSFVKSNKVGTLAIFADSPWIPETISDVLHNMPEVKRCVGAMFDSWDNFPPDFYDRIFLCLQNFPEIGRKCAELILEMLHGRRPTEKCLLEVPPIEIIEIQGKCRSSKIQKKSNGTIHR